MTVTALQISSAEPLMESNDFDLIGAHLRPAGKTLVELGCGAAFTTRRLAERYPDTSIIAFEVDQVQHKKNLAIEDLPNVEFRLGGAEAIELPTDSVDGVMMLKSLHHVPPSLMDKALEEVARILRPDGLAYLSEPVYAGDFNEILRLFNDEKTVREDAFAAIGRIIEQGTLLIDREIHFLSSSRFEGFAEFERRIIGATHSEFSIDDSLLEEIRGKFSQHLNAEGVAQFLNPIRVDLLRKPSR
jgi:SAM-dependent methyltransferase